MHFPKVIDSTLLSAWRACRRKGYYSGFRSLIPSPGPSVHLIAGGAMAKGLEVARTSFYRLGLGKDEAEALGLEALIKAYGDLEPPEKQQHKSWDRTAGAYAYYLDEFPLGQDPVQPLNGHEGIEFTFAVPLPMKNPETGDPLVFGGRFDLVGEFQSALWGVDDKTCSQMGATWPDQWALRGQFLGYCWAARQYGLPLNGMIVRGIAMYKNGYSMGQSIEQYPQWLVDEWEEQMYIDVHAMCLAWENLSITDKPSTRVFPKDFGEACTSYGGCPFKDLCRRQNPEPWIAQSFIEHHWNPLEKGD